MCAAAVDKDKKNIVALHLSGVLEAQQNNAIKALRLFDRALAIKPDAADILADKGKVLTESGRHREALVCFQKAVAINPQHWMALHNQGCTLLALERAEEALVVFDQLVAMVPNFPPAFNNRGVALKRLDRNEEAIVSYRQAIALNGQDIEAWSNLGDALFKLKRHDDAAAAYEKALGIKPDFPEAWLGRANVLYALKRYDDALAAFDRTLALRADYAEAWLGRGSVFFVFKRYDEALAAYGKALALDANLPRAWLGKANVFLKAHHYEEAVAAYERLLALAPDYKFGKGQLLHSKMLCCDWSDLARLRDGIVADIHAGLPSADPFGFQAVATAAQDLKRCAEIYAAERYPASPNPLWNGERYDNAKIRVGYVSGEFRDHVISQLMAGLFERHDKSCFELFAFDNGWDDGSAMRARIDKAFDHIVDIARLDDAQAASAIRERQIDILVDLNGYFGDERTGVFARKPAPVAVSYLGYSATMGAPYIDYILADKFIIPPALGSFYTEKVAYLPDTFQINDTARRAAERTPSRAELGLPDNGFVFCCFNNNFKITPDMFDVWMRLLGDVDGSVLWLSESVPAVSRNLRREAAARGVAPERVVFSGRTATYADYLARYRAADLFLDTAPFNAGATASDALWMGVPLLTCAGEPYTARMAGSLLQATGANELVTTSIADYAAMAVKLARDPVLLASIKAQLVANRDSSPLFDTARMTRHIEAAYIAMVERARRGEAPESFAVS
ncbi:MAG: tetratricopeptide repeat protein [Pseudolabrys sp.]